MFKEYTYVDEDADAPRPATPPPPSSPPAYSARSLTLDTLSMMLENTAQMLNEIAELLRHMQFSDLD